MFIPQPSILQIDVGAFVSWTELNIAIILNEANRQSKKSHKRKETKKGTFYWKNLIIELQSL